MSLALIRFDVGHRGSFLCIFFQSSIRKYMRLHIIIIFHDYIICIKKSTPEKNIVVVHIVGESFFERTRALFCSCVFLVMLKLSISLKYFLSAHFLAHHHVHEL